MPDPGGQARPALLADLTWPEVEERAAPDTVVAIPLGSTEQHGPHLPFSTDADVAADLCRRLATRRGDVLVAPVLAFGASGEHQDFPGTLSIGRAALELVVVELARSAAATFAGTVFVNAHGGNVEALTSAERRLVGEGRRVLAWTVGWRGDAHAGRTETSLELALVPDRVRLERAAAGNRRPLDELMTRLRSQAVRAVSPNGVLGDPAGASAEEGEQILQALAADLVATVDAWVAGPGPS